VIKVRTGITDGRYTEITGQDLKTHGINIGTQVIVAELQSNGQAQAGGNMRGPRMF